MSRCKICNRLPQELDEPCAECGLDIETPEEHYRVPLNFNDDFRPGDNIFVPDFFDEGEEFDEDD